VSNVLGSNQDTAIDIAPARRDFGFDPLALDAGLARVVAGASRGGCDAGDGSPGATTLADEFRLFTRYLLGVEPHAELVERYVAAHPHLLGNPDAARSCRELAFVHRHPRALPFLDAALAPGRTRSLLRRKIFLASAILETSPAHAEFFLDDSHGPLRTLVTLGWNGLASVVKLAIGLPLLLLARGRR
jgi:hypothetical protein